MANYYATCRSNYFAVRDPKLFEKFCDLWNLESWDSNGLYAFAPRGEGGIPSYTTIKVPESCDGCENTCAFCPCEDCTNDCTGCDLEKGNENYELDYEDFEIQLADQIADDHVAILMEVGNEKLRYLSGYAIALNNQGDSTVISLDEIYDRAKELGSQITHAVH
jgi:hypothetical protein